MREPPSISIERVDDVPFIWAHLQAMGIIEEIDAHFDTHGNWDDTLTLGETIGVWMTYMLSEGDHRMSAVEEWVAGLATTWRHVLGREVDAKALCDDRLARALRYLARDQVWGEFEAALGERLVRVYALPEGPVRVDMSTVSVHADAEGLVQFGFSKAHRPDLPQVKVGMATLDPLGMPLATLVVAGNRADDPLYIPLVEQARQVVGAGKLYVGDSKMAALATRAFLHHQGDVYLCPAPRTVVSEETLACDVAEAYEEGRVTTWRWEGEEGKVKEGEAFVVEVQLTGTVGEEEVTWQEERWVIREQGATRRALAQLERRLAQAEADLQALNARGRGKRRYRTREALLARVERILAQYEVAGLLEVTYECEVQEKQVRGYGGRPPRVERREDWRIGAVKRQEEAIAARQRLVGWRVYLTNSRVRGHPLRAGDVVRLYRGQWRVERLFQRMRGRPIGITPLYVRRDDHRKGLLRLFSLVARALTLLEYQVRQGLAQSGQALAGLYEGNPKRRTQQPTAERLLRAFKGIHLAIGRWGGHVLSYVSPLSEVQKRILHVLNFSEEIYQSLGHQFLEPP